MQMDMQESVSSLLKLSRGYVVSRALYVMAKLKIADFLTDDMQPIKDVASKVSIDPLLLFRLFRFLNGYDVIHMDNERVKLTPLSKALQSNHSSKCSDVICMVDDMWWEAFSSFEKVFLENKSGFEISHNDNFFDYLSQNEEKRVLFDKGMASLSAFEESLIAASFDFSLYTSIADIGGGRGGLIKAIQASYPNLTYTLFDSPSVISHIDRQSFSFSIELQAGNFFNAIPTATLLIFKGVLHDFDDENTSKILTLCKNEMQSNQRLLIIEQVMPDSSAPHPNKTMDMVMLALLGGRQRTLIEWESLLHAHDFTLTTVKPTTGLFTLMLFKPKYG
jgi:C-methyltransferase